MKKVLSIPLDPDHLQNIAFWVSAFTAGLVSVLYAWLFKTVESAYHQLLPAHSALLFIWTPLCLLGAWALVAYLAPEASGSGIPQVLAANDLEYSKHSKWVDGLLSLKGILVKIVSSLMATLGGAVTGREGPTIQISAAIFHGAGRLFQSLKIKTDPTAWIVAGAAAGLASAFNTPLGGIVFAIEEMSVHFKRFRTVLISSIIIAGLVSQWIMGSYLYLGYPHLGPIPVSDLTLGIVLGMVSGVFGALYGKALKALLEFKMRVRGRTRLAALALGCGFLLALFAFLNPQASGSGLEVISSLLFHGEKADWSLPLLRAAGSLSFYLSGAAGGIFAPALAAGACTGSFLSTLIHNDSNLMVLLGMVGFLTGVTRTPFTAFVLVMEMTDHHMAIFPSMLSALTAEGSAHYLDKESFYEWARRRFMPPSRLKARPS